MNFCEGVVKVTKKNPHRLALVVPRAVDDYISNETITYAELLARASRIQYGLSRAGLCRGDRVLILSRPTIGLYALVLALLGAGLVPVLVDRGMSRDRALAAIRASNVKAAIGDYDILRLWWLFQPLWRLPRFALDGRGLGVSLLQQPIHLNSNDFKCLSLSAKDHGLITFTSGSTGIPKGADRHHGSLIAQHNAIRQHWPDMDTDIDMPCFPVLVLHNLSCGIRTVLPAIDLAHPNQANPYRVIDQLRSRHITRVACAPAFLDKLVTHAIGTQQSFIGIRSIVIGGATLPERLAQQVQTVFPNAHIRFVYGSTEAEPIADIDLTMLLQQWHTGTGHLVGKPASMVEVVLVDPSQPLLTAEHVQKAQVSTGSIGEILVAGAHVLAGYIDNPDANRENKIPRPDGLTWHRTGDTGYLDDTGHIWLTGRVKDTLYHEGRVHHPLVIEKHIDALAGVHRSAVIQGQHPDNSRLIVVIEGHPNTNDIASALSHFKITQAHIAIIDSMPVDGRHNSKIDRVHLRNLLERDKLRLEAISPASLDRLKHQLNEVTHHG